MKNSMKRFAHTSVISLFLSGSSVFADTHYVDIKSSKPSPPYTSWETAATRISEAVQYARNGDTVLVGDGTYEITKQINISKELTVRSLNGSDVTIVSAGGKDRVFRLNAGTGPVTLDGFTVTGGYTEREWSNGGGIAASGDHPLLISNCVIIDNASPRQGGGVCIGASKGVIANCVIANNRADGVGGGVYPVLKDESTGSISIENCTIVGNQAVNGGGVGRLTPDPIMRNIKVVDCILYKNSNGGLRRVNAYNSYLYGNNASDCDDARCRNTNPKFVDAGNGNYRLKAGSPCIDAGSIRSAPSSLDLAGQPRIVDGDRDGKAVADIGAYEFQILQVEIDIKPDSENKAVNLQAKGFLPVAILTTDTFDASEINPATVRFAEAKPVRRMFRDVDGDGDADLLMAFERKRLKLNDSSLCTHLTGETKDKEPFIGEAEISIVH